LRDWPHASLLCPVVGRHPLEKPWVSFVMASHFEVDQHTSPHKRSAMLKAFLTGTRRYTKRCETKALRQS
jgi:hypothetical protein